MNEVVVSIPLRSTSVSSVGHPEDFRDVASKLDAIITLATKLEDWPVLEHAVDAKIAEQREFVTWWTTSVQKPGGDRSDTINARSALMVSDAETKTGVSQQQVSRFRKNLSNIDKYRTQIILAAFRKAGLKPAENHRAEGTGENEWFTPTKYIEAARQVMGGIDLDPASNPIAQRTVRAGKYYTQEDDGLTQEWEGRIWLNPPYAQPLIGQFVEKLVSEFIDQRLVAEAILLTHNYTDTAWFHMAESAASLICFTRGRVKFVNADGDECAPTQGQAFFYYGAKVEEFRETFGKFGFVR